MDGIPLSAQFTALILLLALSGFFSMSETVMMAANRHRLKHAAQQGNRGARMALNLLEHTDRLFGVILLGNTLFNAGAATLASVICVELLGEAQWVLGASTLIVTFLMLVLAEITPKVVGAANADRFIPAFGFVLMPLLKACYPVIWFVNLFVRGLLFLLRQAPAGAHGEAKMTVDDLRLLVLEVGHFIPQKHQSILLNLFELENITMEDVMTPRGAIESLDLSDPLDDIRNQLATSYHTRLAVYDGNPDQVIGILHLRHVLGTVLNEDLARESLRKLLAEPYFIPATTPIYTQLHYFQENRQRVALVVDEYGEIVGLVTLEDIIEEIIGKFTTGVPDGALALQWQPQSDGSASVLVDGSRSLREINRKLDLKFPLDGPKTLNGLILEHFQDIPEAGVSLKIEGIPMEIVHTQNRMVKTVRLTRLKV